jgi:hypothetical protein
LALNIDFLVDGLGWIYVSLSFFGFPYIPLCYAIGYIFKNPDLGYKYAVYIGLLLFAVKLGLGYLIPGSSSVLGAIIPWTSLSNTL